MARVFYFFRILFFFAIITLLNFGVGSLIRNSFALDSSQETLIQSENQNLNLGPNKFIATSEKNILNSNILSSSDSFDPTQIPYFQTKTSEFGISTTITIFNPWSENIEVLFKNSAGSVETESVQSSSSQSFEKSDIVTIYIRATSTSGFRTWVDSGKPLIKTNGSSDSIFDSYSYIPDMRYFTTDASGTEAGNLFFSDFLNFSTATSLPDGSFDLSRITKVGDSFFNSFAESSALQTLPEGSFDTSNITEAGLNFFANFNKTGALSSLPVGSFNFDSLESHNDGAFHDFNNYGRLATLPYNSFNLSSVTTTSTDNLSLSYFNYMGDLSKVDDGGISIVNTSVVNRYFFYGAYNEGTFTANTGSTEINSGSKFSAYAADPLITNISPKTVQNSKATTINISGHNLQGTYSFRIKSFRFDEFISDNVIYPTSSVIVKTESSAILIIPKTAPWVGSYTLQLLTGGGAVATETTFTYQLPLGAAKNFSDISKLSTTRQNSVKWLGQTGVTGGCDASGKKYCPEDPVTRGSMAVFLQMLAGYPVGTSNYSSFADVFTGSAKTITYISGSKTTKTKVSALSEKRISAINWLAQTGITAGSGSAKVSGNVEPTFRAQDVVNRGSMASFMLKFSEDVVSTITSDAQTGFADVKIGSGNFTITYKGSSKGVKVSKMTTARATAIKWMQVVGITGGSGTDQKGNLTYRPQDAVNRGSMAAFMKNLAVYMGYTS